jgi:hypothetical protein
MKAKLKIRNKEDYVKHLLNHHEGEARFVGDSRWNYSQPLAGENLGMRAIGVTSS